jgi:uncharacterized protein (DUF3084 family)
MSDTKALNNLRDNVTRELNRANERISELTEERDRARRFAISFEQENAVMQAAIQRLQTRCAVLEGRVYAVQEGS